MGIDIVLRRATVADAEQLIAQTRQDNLYAVIATPTSNGDVQIDAMSIVRSNFEHITRIALAAEALGYSVFRSPKLFALTVDPPWRA